MMKTFRIVCLVTLAFLIGGSSLLADTVTLKDGTVLEGEIVREVDGAIFLKVTVGGIVREQFITADRIESIERDEAGKVDEDSDMAAKESREAKSARGSSGATRIAFISLEGVVGQGMSANALEHSVDLLEDDDVDIIVLVVNSGGGLLSEVMPLSDVIHEEIKAEYRVVGWVRSAISAAAMTILTCEDLYITSDGNIGGATAFVQDSSGKATAAQGEDLERILLLGERLSRRGRHNPLILRAMQDFMTLSCDIDEQTGEITWYDDNQGRYIVSRENNILTFNSIEAVRYGVARGVADTKDELAKNLGVTEWVEVGHEADEYQQEFRENVARAEVAIQELLGKMQIAMESGQPARARRFLGEIRAWIRRAPSLAQPDGLYSPRWFREIERQIDELRESRRRRR